MSWNDASVKQLHTAVESFDRPGVDRICAELVAHLRNSESPPSEYEAGLVLALLQRKRHFQHLQRIADAYIHNGLDRPFVRQSYAQALLDQDMLTAGLSILGGLIETTGDAEELAEADGLVGRANKQLYVLTGTSAGQRRHAYLRRAIGAYSRVYQAEPRARLWHGINTAALLKRAASDGVDVPGFPDPGEAGDLIARQVLDVIMAKPEQDAFITFRALGQAPDAGQRHQVRDVLWTSPRDELDAAVVSLRSEPAGVTPCPTARALPPLDSSPPPRAFIVGHPSGRMLPMFSIQDNLMLDYDGTRVHYRAPTEPGSSGSPVFDRWWKPIALHHAGTDEMPMLHGGGTYQANEGIWIGRIKEAIRHDLERRGA